MSRVMRGFERFTPVDEAIRRAMKHLRRMGEDDVEVVGIDDACGRILAEDIVSGADIPPFNRSAVDGFAVRAEDTYGASIHNPVRLRVLGVITAGTDPAELKPVGRGESYEIYTGGPLPPGADAVVMAEDAAKLDGYVEVYSQVPPMRNVSRRGEDFRAGETVLSRGTIIRPWHVAALASLNISKVRVFRRLVVAVISTGDELVEVGGAVPPGKIVNSTKHFLKGLVAEEGWTTLDFGIVGDDVDRISETLGIALSQSDAVIVTGGTSVGRRDLVPEAVERVADKGLVVHGVALRPGRTAGIGFHGHKPIFILSGFPVAAYTGFLALIKPLLRKVTWAEDTPVPRVRARLTRRVAKPIGFRSYVRVVVRRGEDGLVAEPLRLTGSGILSTLIRGNGLLIVPEEVEGYDEGEEVEVILVRGVSG